MEELEEKIVSMIINGEKNTTKYNDTMREYIKCIIETDYAFSFDYSEDNVFTNNFWEEICNTVKNDAFITNVMTEDYHENRDHYKTSFQDKANHIDFNIRLEV